MVKPITYWDIIKNIKSKKIDPVYLFTDEELFLKRQVTELIKSIVVEDSSVDFNYNVFYAEDANIEEVLSIASTNAFLGNKRLVILKNVEKFSSAEKKILSFLKKPSLKTVFIMHTNKKATDKFIKKISPFTTLVSFAAMKQAELSRWINSFVQEHGKRISYEGIVLLIEKVGTELDALVNALNKLFLFAGDNMLISEIDIDALIKKTRQDTRFTFLNAIMSKQTSKALEMAQALSRDGKNATDLIGLINWQMKRLETFKNLQERGFNKDTISKELKMIPYVFNIVNRQASSFSKNQLKRGFELLLESDVAIKQGLKSPSLTLETLIVQLCNDK